MNHPDIAQGKKGKYASSSQQSPKPGHFAGLGLAGIAAAERLGAE